MSLKIILVATHNVRKTDHLRFEAKKQRAKVWTLRNPNEFLIRREIDRKQKIVLCSKTDKYTRINLGGVFSQINAHFDPTNF